MKPRNRELNIFSMSALDLFASALGAFILLAVIALPFFANTHRLDDETLLAQLDQLHGELTRANDRLRQEQEARHRAERAQSECQARVERETEARHRTEADLNECVRAAQANFLLVLISWATTDDVDLHVTDPEGREFYYASRAHAGSSARFEEDNLRGPGNEIWLHPSVTPGDYRVEYVLYSRGAGPSGPVRVRGAALHKDGRTTFTELTLSSAGERRLAARIRISADGSVSVL